MSSETQQQSVRSLDAAAPAKSPSTVKMPGVFTFIMTMQHRLKHTTEYIAVNYQTRQLTEDAGEKKPISAQTVS